MKTGEVREVGIVYRLCSLPQNQTELCFTLRQAWIL